MKNLNFRAENSLGVLVMIEVVRQEFEFSRQKWKLAETSKVKFNVYEIFVHKN